MSYYKDDKITTVVTAEKIVPIAKQCVKAIQEHQAKENIRLLTETMNEFNSHWFNKLCRKSIKNLKEAEEYEKELWKSSVSFRFRKWPCTDYCSTEGRAQEIIDSAATSADPKATYTLPLDIYNAIASFCE